VQLAPLVAAAGRSRLGVQGQATAELALRGHGLSAAEILPSVQGTAHVAIQKGRIEGLHLVKEGLALLNALGVLTDARDDATVFSAAEGNFTVKHEIVTVDRLQMGGSDFQATATGKVGFDRTLRLKASLTLSDSLSAQVGRLRPMKLAMVDGRLRVPMVIGGTLQAPAFTLDLEQVGAQVEKQVKGKLTDVLKSKAADEALRKAGEALKDLFGR
jgi:AsmA protein